ncbi:hypothetical protein BKA70DRAFT_480322 [Coprinopsis sp. MPI-PUGE-AT-0042]|nr:hypothetical protein BKA70DRAFT_480322 [Coprinopsis sp. MPI-PUGE-AT-0042]
MRRTLDRVRKRMSVKSHRPQLSRGNTEDNTLVAYNPDSRETEFQAIVDAFVDSNRRDRVEAPGVEAQPGEPANPVTVQTVPPTDLPLPSEVFDIIARQLSGETVALLRLARALPAIRHYCWEGAFKLVRVAIREREGRKAKLTSNVDLFLQLITNDPEILFYIGGFDVQDCGRYNYNPDLNPTTLQDFTTLAMLLVQSQRMPNLRTFKIQSARSWAVFPKHLKAAFVTLLQSPSLQEVWLADLGLPINLVALAANLRAVDIQTGGASMSIVHPLVPLTPRKEIHMLKIRDRNPYGQAVQTLGLVDPRKGPRAGPFSLPYLKHLDICLPGNRLELIQAGISQCVSLEVLKIFAGTAGGLPTPLSLNSSPSLKSLTLSADITSLVESERRFQWLIDALGSLPDEPVLQDLTIVIRTDTLARGRQCDWNSLDEVFEDSDKWQKLQRVSIIWCTARAEDVRQELNQDFINDLPALLPHLSGREVVRVLTTYSDAEYNFWTFKDNASSTRPAR